MKASPSRCVRVALIFVAPLWLGACFFSSSDEPREHDDAEGASPDAGNFVEPVLVPVSAPVPPPFSMSFEKLITQPVRWAAFDVSVTAVRQVRGIGTADPLNVLLGKPKLDTVYVELTLKLDNHGAEEVDYTDRGTWDLLLASGERLRSIDALGVSVLPGDSATAVLHYAIPEIVDLTGSKLLLAGVEREELEPEEVPLDAPYQKRFPRRISSLVGMKAGEPTDDFMFQIDEAVFDINAGRLSRASVGKRIVWLAVAVTATDEEFFSGNDARVSIDGRAAAPFEYDFDTISAGETKVFRMYFEVPPTTSGLDLVLPLTDYRTNADARSVRLHADLEDAVLANDIP